MKAVLSVKPGPPEDLVIEETIDPAPGVGQVLIRVAAVGVNYPDALIIEDKYQEKPARPFSPGSEVSGIVEAVGKNVKNLKPGDRVLAITVWGGMAEFVAVDAWRCSPVPDSMPFDEAAAFLLTFGTTYHAVADRARLQADETLLVLGATGGVGLAAVALGKAMGARVIAAVSSQEKLEVALENGADAGVVYGQDLSTPQGQRDLKNELKQVCGSDGADVVFDPVGGLQAEPAMRSMAWRGRYLVIGFAAGIPSIPMNLPLLKEHSILGVYWGEAIRRDNARHHEMQQALFSMYESKLIAPVISARYNLSQAGKAIRDLVDRRAIGKIVVTVA